MEKNFSSNGRKIRRLLDVTHKDDTTVSLSNKILEKEPTGVSNKKSEEQMKKYKRHQSIDLINEKNIRRRRHLQMEQKLKDKAVKKLVESEILLTESQGYIHTEPTEKRSNLSQKNIYKELDLELQSKLLKLNLPGGPFTLDFTSNGRYLLSGGRHFGALSIIDCLTFNVMTETHVNECIRDACFLQNETMFAAAQKKYVYIYDNQGLELHCLREHMMTYQMQFLPHHYLLTTIGEFGELRYLDVSTGLVAAAHKTKKGPCHVMSQNPSTAVISLGHYKGTVSLWTPNVGKPIVEFLGHGGKITALCSIDANYMATAGLDGTWKVWDMRKFMHVNSYRYFGSAPKAIDISQEGGILGIGFGSHIQFWKNCTSAQKDTSPFLTHELPGTMIESLKFRPYEDFCCVGLSTGIDTMIVPGSGLANFDSHRANPYETARQRREKEIHSLLDKLPADTITYDPSKLGLLDEAPRNVICEEEDLKRLQLQEEKEKKQKKRFLKNKTSALREKVLRKKYAELSRKKAEHRRLEESLNASKKNENQTSLESHTDQALSLNDTNDSFDALQRFSKKNKEKK